MMGPIIVFAPNPESAKKKKYRIKKDKWVAYLDDPGVEGVGNTPDEAVQNCKIALIEYIKEQLNAVEFNTENGCFLRHLDLNLKPLEE